MGIHLPKQAVVVVHNPGTDQEERHELHAHVQPGMGFFELNDPIYEGDIIEVADPRAGSGGLQRKHVVSVEVFNLGSSIDHIEARLKDAPRPRVAPVRRISFDGLHADVREAAGDLFADGHLAQSIQAAFKAVEIRVRSMTGDSEPSASKLMSNAFGRLDVSTTEGPSATAEREGFKLLAMGAMQSVRNPAVHTDLAVASPHEALEILGLASLIMRRLDLAQTRLTQHSGPDAS